MSEPKKMTRIQEHEFKAVKKLQEVGMHTKEIASIMRLSTSTISFMRRCNTFQDYVELQHQQTIKKYEYKARKDIKDNLVTMPKKIYVAPRDFNSHKPTDADSLTILKYPSKNNYTIGDVEFDKKQFIDDGIKDIVQENVNNILLQEIAELQRIMDIKLDDLLDRVKYQEHEKKVSWFK